MNTKLIAAAAMLIAANISVAGTNNLSDSDKNPQMRVLVAASSNASGAGTGASSALVQVTMALDDTVLTAYPELADLKAIANYSVNCKNNTLAIANFEVSRGAAAANTATEAQSTMEYAAVRFYSDYAIVQAACTSDLAMLKQ